jgi:hypothetical protein
LGCCQGSAAFTVNKIGQKLTWGVEFVNCP